MLGSSVSISAAKDDGMSIDIKNKKPNNLTINQITEWKIYVITISPYSRNDPV